MSTLETLNFDNKALRELPIDSVEQNYVRTVSGACFSKVPLLPVKNPQLVCASADAVTLLDLPASEIERKEFAEYFGGNKLLPGSETAAHCYCGHQFGYFSGQLGDGAAMYLGEIVNKKGERWEIQIKGGGPTPYSRQADGRKVLRSSIREFLCSEAMHYLGVPTTRAGSCITSDSYVDRDIFYDGHPIKERCTIVLRIAPTFIRFGSFEIFKTIDQFTGRRGPSVGRMDILKQLVDYTISTFYPEMESMHKDNNLERLKAFYKEVIIKTAHLAVWWQCVGFCHGVLNTDNMSIVGLTIDYGPFGFLDRFDPDHICNTSDDNGRYTYVKQPEICHFNLQKLAECLQTMLPLSESLPILEEVYQAEFDKFYMEKMRRKLGLFRKSLPGDSDLLKSLLETMEASGADFTSTFRLLSLFELNSKEFEPNKQILENILLICSPVEELIRASEATIDQRQYQMILMLMRSNPELLEQLGQGTVAVERIKARIEKAETLKKLTPALKMSQDTTVWTDWLKKYEERIRLEFDNSTNEEEINIFMKERVEIMNANNPCYILRNYVAQQAIEKAEKGDFSEVVNVLERLKKPYESDQNACQSIKAGICRPPPWALDIKVSCSS